MRGKDGLLMVVFRCRKHASLSIFILYIPALADVEDISTFSDGAKPS
jgi:hypothetical protein